MLTTRTCHSGQLSEAEIGLHYIIWVTCAMSPALVPFVFWLAGWRKGLVFAAIVGAAMLWPNREWLNPPKSRLGNPVSHSSRSSSMCWRLYLLTLGVLFIRSTALPC